MYRLNNSLNTYSPILVRYSLWCPVARMIIKDLRCCLWLARASLFCLNRMVFYIVYHNTDIWISGHRMNACNRSAFECRQSPALVAWISPMVVWLTLVLVGFSHFAFSHFWNFSGYFTNQWTNTKYVCIYFNVFLMVVPNMVMKFQHFDIFLQICYIFDPSSAIACRVENIKNDSPPQQVHTLLP